MILKISRGGRIVGKSHDNPVVDVSDQAIEYLFDGVGLDPDVTLKDIFLILKKNPALLQVFRRIRAEELMDAALASHSETVIEYGEENIEYISLYWAGNSEKQGESYLIWPKMSMCGVGYALKKPLETESYGVFPVGARQSWALEFCSPGELVEYPVRIESKIEIKTDDCPKWINMGLPCLGKVIEGMLYCLSWYGSQEDRTQIASEILRASTGEKVELKPEHPVA